MHTKRLRFGLALAAGITGCGAPPQPEDVAAAGDALQGFASEADARSRLVWEAARAMVGPSAAGSYAWSSTSTFAGYAYAAEDLGAWGALLAAPQYGYGWYVSCRAYQSQPILYSPCSLSYGARDALASYGLQRSLQGGPARYRGGQCKAFQNLVAYRSGVYHGTNWSFKALPSDSSIATMPLATPSTVRVGDLLRKTTAPAHAAIVVRLVDSSHIVVIDSNYLDGDGDTVADGNGQEEIGSHVLTFGTVGITNPGEYHRLQCVYDGTC